MKKGERAVCKHHASIRALKKKVLALKRDVTFWHSETKTAQAAHASCGYQAEFWSKLFYAMREDLRGLRLRNDELRRECERLLHNDARGGALLDARAGARTDKK